MLAAKYGYFENAIHGYDLSKIPGSDRRKWLIFTDCDYTFTLNLEKPLTFHYPDGIRVQPDRHEGEITNMGSVPAPLQLVIPKDRFLLSFCFHDSGYKHHGLYVSFAPGDPFAFVQMNQGEVDQFLWQGVAAEGGNSFQRQVVYRAVRAWGWASW